MKKWALYTSHWKSRISLFMLSNMLRWTEVLPEKIQEAFELILVFQGGFYRALY